MKTTKKLMAKGFKRSKAGEKIRMILRELTI